MRVSPGHFRPFPRADISLALSLTVIPVLWLMARYVPQYLWYSYLVAYVIEAVVIFILHKARHIQFKQA